MGVRWTLRGPGRSTMPTRIANARTGTVNTSDADKPIKKASRPELMSPSYARSEETGPGESTSDSQTRLPVWGPAPKSIAASLATGIGRQCCLVVAHTKYSESQNNSTKIVKNSWYLVADSLHTPLRALLAR